MKKTIKIGFVDFWEHFNHKDNFIINILKDRYNIELSNKPQYIFYSNFSKELNHLLYNDCVKIFYTQENIVPDFNFCDYGIGFEHMKYKDRYFRYPLYYYRYQEDFRLMETKHLITDEEIYGKNKFCSMVVSNSQAMPYREHFFELLCNYKKVNSGGRFKNNIGRPSGIKNKRLFQQKHKFALCFENSIHDGYTTEKIIEAYAAKTVPIYWGDPSIEEYFNKDSFVNVGSYSSMDVAIEAVKRIDQDALLYSKMIRTPALKCPERNCLDYVNNAFRLFLYNIFDQPIEKAFRRNRIYWGGRYQNLLLQMRKAYLREQKIKNVKNFLRKLRNIDVEGDEDKW